MTLQITQPESKACQPNGNIPCDSHGALLPKPIVLDTGKYHPGAKASPGCSHFRPQEKSLKEKIPTASAYVRQILPVFWQRDQPTEGSIPRKQHSVFSDPAHIWFPHGPDVGQIWADHNYNLWYYHIYRSTSPNGRIHPFFTTHNSWAGK